MNVREKKNELKRMLTLRSTDNLVEVSQKVKSNFSQGT